MNRKRCGHIGAVHKFRTIAVDVFHRQVALRLVFQVSNAAQTVGIFIAGILQHLLGVPQHTSIAVLYGCAEGSRVGQTVRQRDRRSVCSGSGVIIGRAER